MGGSPTKRLPEVRSAILAALELGATKLDAAQAAGISHTTFQEWCRDEPSFAADVKAAQSKMRAQNLELIRKAARAGTWQASAWLLERTDPEHYGRTIQETRVRQLDLTPEELAGMSDEDVERLYARLAGPESAGD